MIMINFVWCNFLTFSLAYLIIYDPNVQKEKGTKKKNQITPFLQIFMSIIPIYCGGWLLTWHKNKNIKFWPFKTEWQQKFFVSILTHLSILLWSLRKFKFLFWWEQGLCSVEKKLAFHNCTEHIIYFTSVLSLFMLTRRFWKMYIPQAVKQIRDFAFKSGHKEQRAELHFIKRPSNNDFV